MTDEEYKTLNSYFKTKDKESMLLGFHLLSSFNFKEDYQKITSLLFFFLI